MQISISSLQTHNVNRCGRSRQAAYAACRPIMSIDVVEVVIWRESSVSGGSGAVQMFLRWRSEERFSRNAETELVCRLLLEKKNPTTVAACVGGGSNALGIFHAFLDDREVELVGVEAAGEGLASGRHSASLARGRPGVFHGSLSYLLQDGDGQVQPAHSVSAGLDYPGVGPEHAYLKDTGRVLYVAVTDQEALAAFAALSRLEGILPALESAHALAWVLGRRGNWRAGDLVLINLSGRGDKDVAMVAELTGAKL